MAGYYWVEYRPNHWNKRKGIVYEGNYGYYLFYDLRNNKPISVGKENLTFLPDDINKEDIQELIDLALDTKDHEWFDELIEKFLAFN